MQCLGFESTLNTQEGRENRNNSRPVRQRQQRPIGRALLVVVRLQLMAGGRPCSSIVAGATRRGGRQTRDRNTTQRRTSAQSAKKKQQIHSGQAKARPAARFSVSRSVGRSARRWLSTGSAVVGGAAVQRPMGRHTERPPAGIDLAPKLFVFRPFSICDVTHGRLAQDPPPSLAASKCPQFACFSLATPSLPLTTNRQSVYGEVPDFASLIS